MLTSCYCPIHYMAQHGFDDLFLEELKEPRQYPTMKSWDFNNVSSGTGGNPWFYDFSLNITVAESRDALPLKTCFPNLELDRMD